VSEKIGADLALLEWGSENAVAYGVPGAGRDLFSADAQAGIFNGKSGQRHFRD
jgi:hypothetical protein